MAAVVSPWASCAVRAALSEAPKSCAAAGTPPGELVEVTDSGLPAGVSLRWMRGVAVEPMCLACHGKALELATRAALQRLYPTDSATGFAAGDLRGALWVEVPAGRGPGTAP